jgi:NodT family efflux transporter outer membrane factor (OMF) lipoprotein
MSYLRWSVGFVLCLSIGCSVHQVDEEAELLEVEVPPRFAETATGADLPTDWDYAWWESFADDTLNRLVETGLAANFGLRQYVARIEQAVALARQAGARLYPSLGLDAGYQWEWDGATASEESRDLQETSELSFPLSWELDVWGRLSSLRRAEDLSVQATVEDWLAARLLLSAAIAEIYFDIQEQRRQLEVIREQIDINQTLLQLTSLRFGQGQSSIVDVLQQQEQLEATQARIPETEARIGQLVYSLEVLLGKPPGTQPSVTAGRLGRPSPLPAVGVPAQLLTRRPDLRAAQKRVLALDYEVGAAVADQFPTLVVGGSLGWRGDPGFADTVTTAFAGLAGPLFDAGERRSEVAFRRARLEEALVDYSARYLSALSEVEIALLQERKSAEQLVLVEQQLETAQRLLTEARNRFSQGLTDYLPVFTSLNIVQDLERDVVSARKRVLSARVALHRALGGPMPTPDSSANWACANE